MKLSMNVDFTKLPRAETFIRAPGGAAGEPSGRARLAHDERRLRRKVLTLETGDRVLVDLPEPVAFDNGDLLVLDDGRMIEVAAADEELYDVRGVDPIHLTELAWHIGNRRLAAQMSTERIVILRDRVIRTMLEDMGATVSETIAPFSPLQSAYSGHFDAAQPDAYGRMPGDPHYGHDHGPHQHHHDHGDHQHDHGHHHGAHDRGEPDRFGRFPGDPHYGHNHA